MVRSALLLLVLGLSGCGFLESVAVDVCVDYKGQHVCVGRANGLWTFTADLKPLSTLEEDEIILSLGGSR